MLGEHCSRQFVPRRAGEWYNNEFLRGTVKNDGGYLQIYGCISANGVEIGMIFTKP